MCYYLYPLEVEDMTPISLFYGIIIYMYTDKSREYKVPHVHAVFKEE